MRVKIVTPAQFWRLDPEELRWMIEALNVKDYAGGMDEDTVAELYRLNYGDDDDD